MKEGFGPLPEGFRYVPLHDQAALEAAVSEHTAAIMLETVQAEGGVYPVQQEYLEFVRGLCDKHGVLLIIDEIQTGMGRTGKLFSYEHYSVEPDIFTLAKGLGSGFPVGAMLAKEKLRDAFAPGSHGSTFGGTPIATAAVKATVETIVQDRVADQAAQTGAYLTGKLKETLSGNPFVKDIRGKGLIIGIECAEPVSDLVTEARNRGLLVVTAGPNVIRLLPSLIITNEEIDHGVQILSTLLAEQATSIVKS